VLSSIGGMGSQRRLLFVRRVRISRNGRKFVEEEFSWGGFEDNGSNIVLSPEEDLGLHETPHISG